MERAKIRTKKTWHSFDFWAIVISIMLLALLLFMWLGGLGPGREDCCEDDQLEKADYALQINRKGRIVNLQGEVSDDDTLNSILKAAEKSFAGDVLVSGLSVNEGVKDLNTRNFAKLFDTVKGITNMSLMIAPEKLTVGGSVTSGADRDRILQAMPSNVDALINNVELVEPVDCNSIISGVNIEFATGKSDLTEAGKKVIIRLFDCLTNSNFEIVGHSDSVGDADSNRTLSWQRAVAVKDYLDVIGLDTSNVQVTGKGEDEPLVDDQGQGDPRNRRIEFKPINQ